MFILKEQNINKEEVLNIAKKHNGYIYCQIVKEYKIPTIYLSRLVKENRLEKVYKGIFITPDTIADDYYIYNLKYPNLIYCGESALFLNGLSCKQTVNMEGAIAYGENRPKIPKMNVRISRLETVKLGVTSVETPFGNIIKCYDKERSICELFINPEHYDAEDRAFAITEYCKRYMNLEKLYDYAKALKIYEKVRNVFEVISWN